MLRELRMEIVFRRAEWGSDGTSGGSVRISRIRSIHSNSILKKIFET